MTRTALPLPVRLLNGAFAALGPLGRRLLPLDPERLMQAAARTTALEDFGSAYFREPLARLCDSLEQDARLTALGRMIARQDILRLLGNRLQFVDLFRRHPEIADGRVVAPVFILGMPRTGTTSMHELLALDPQFRVPLSWEVAHPFPPPETATYRTDPRIARVAAELARVDQLLPEFRFMHPMGAELPQECVALFAHDFVSMIFDVQFRLPAYQAWMVKEDMGEVFRNHRRWLQLLQWKKPGDTWVLKSPQYLWNVADMLREYPDARAIQMHRDPVAVAMSVGSLTATLRSLASNEVDLREVTQHYADLLHFGTERTVAARASGLLGADRVIDVQFADFRRDPLAEVRRVYAQLGFVLAPETAEAMQRFLDKGREGGRHARHRYDLATSGLDLARERERFAAYQRAYGIASEVSR
jgi:hypothetical protein